MKKIISVLTVLAICLSLCTVAFAANENNTTTPGGTASSQVKLTTAAPVFDVTVPTALPVSIAEDGYTATVSKNLEIENNCFGQVKVSKVQVNAAEGWTLVDFGTDFSKVKVDAKQFGIKLKNSDVPATGLADLTNFTAINGLCTMPLTYEVTAAVQSTALSGVNIATVVFTIGWSK